MFFFYFFFKNIYPCSKVISLIRISGRFPDFHHITVALPLPLPLQCPSPYPSKAHLSPTYYATHEAMKVAKGGTRYKNMGFVWLVS